MEEDPEKGSSSPSSTCSRWNPTKEQISVLEGLYRQGIRTPTAEQIQEITGKLREYGNIEGKNVFYWFQNHKARQRQRQKQEGLAYFNRFLQKTVPPGISPSPPPTCANVLCSPYYMPQYGAGIGLYPQHPKVILPALVNGKPAAEYQSMGVARERNLEVYKSSQPPYGCDNLIGGDGGGSSIMSIETLQLFPLHPTGVLKERSAGSSFPSTSTESESLEGEEEGGENNPFIINFFDAPRHC